MVYKSSVKVIYVYARTFSSCCKFVQRLAHNVKCFRRNLAKKITKIDRRFKIAFKT